MAELPKITGVSDAPAASAVSPGASFIPVDQMKWSGATGVAPPLGQPTGVPGAQPPSQPAVQPPEEARPEMLRQGVGDIRQIEQQRQQQGDQMQQQAQASAPHLPTEDEMRLPPQQAQQFFPLMMLLSAIGGAKTATPMTAALQNMNGVLQAQIAGSKDMAEHHEKEMMANYQAALDAHKEMLADMKPKIEALANGSPESVTAIRHFLMEHGYRASEIDQLTNGDSYKNMITLYADKNKAQEANQKEVDAKNKADADRASREKVADDRLHTMESKVHELENNSQYYAAAGEAGASGYGTKAMVEEIKGLEKLHPDFSLPEIAHNIKEEQGLNQTLNAQQKQYGMINGFEKTVAGNIKLLTDELEDRKKGNNLDTPFSNKVRLAIHDFEGVPDAEKALIYGKELAGELTKLTTTANAAGVGGTEGGREKWENFFAQYKSIPQLTASLDAATASAGTRLQGARDAIEETKRAQRDLWSKGGTGGGKVMSLDAWLKSQGQ